MAIEQDLIDELKATLPELPDAKQERFQSEYGLSAYDAGILTSEREIADYFEAVAKAAGDAKLAANWVMVELMGRLNKEGIEFSETPVSADQLGGLIQRIRDNTISGKIAKQVFEALWNGEGDSADAVIEATGLKQMSDSGELEKMVDQVLANNPDQVEQYKAADEGKRKKMLGFFVGQIMKASKGQANPGMVNQLLNKKLG